IVVSLLVLGTEIFLFFPQSQVQYAVDSYDFLLIKVKEYDTNMHMNSTKICRIILFRKKTNQKVHVQTLMYLKNKDVFGTFLLGRLVADHDKLFLSLVNLVLFSFSSSFGFSSSLVGLVSLSIL
ncbi:hypothetical protein ACJX0J_018122, partial [Zea mays]